MQATPELEIARNLPRAGCSVEEARRYTRWLATHHYENFNVVSWLLPRRLHQHFYNVYAYCRWADDLGDEVSDPQKALKLLDEWERELRRCFAGGAGSDHPVFIALRETIISKHMRMVPFLDLLRAFRMDQKIHRYETWEDVLGYCKYSANPVGRLVLYLCDYPDEARQSLSDFICTALQLANFWQDVDRDLEKGRIYIPLDILRANGLTVDDVVARRFDERFVKVMKELIVRTRALFAQGAPLARQVSGGLRVDIEVFTKGGLAVLDGLEAVGYDTLHHRPAIGRATQLRLLGGALLERCMSWLWPGPADSNGGPSSHGTPAQNNPLQNRTSRDLPPQNKSSRARVEIAGRHA